MIECMYKEQISTQKYLFYINILLMTSLSLQIITSPNSCICTALEILLGYSRTAFKNID